MKALLRAIFIAVLISMVVCSVVLVGAVEAKRRIEVVSQLDGDTIKQRFSTGANYAIIIGINTYRHHPNLKTALNDAEAVASLLEKKYFFDNENIYLIKEADATKERIMQVFRDLVAAKVKKGDNVFIYYAGHGWYDDILKQGYWVTTEATTSPATFLENNTIYKFIGALDERGVQHVLLVSDSCFSGAFTKEHRTIETAIDDRYFREKYTKPSRNVLTSGGIEPVEDVGKGGHSVFAYYFLKTLQDNPHPYLSAKQLGVQVEELVTRNSIQTPLSRFIHGVGDEGGQFFFIASSSGAIVEDPSKEEAVSTLSVEANVSGARVLVDGRQVGTTPLTDREVSPGEHRIQVEKEGYEPYQKRVRFEPGRAMSLYVDLSPSLPKKARLFVETEPHDARVEITNIAQRFYQGIELEPGRYQVEVNADDCEKKSLWVSLDVGEDKNLNIVLKPLPAAKEGKTFTNSIGMKFVLIPAGTFTMGSPTDEQGREDDERQHRVTLSKPFYMQATEVTVGQWRSFIQKTGFKTDAETKGGAWIWTGKKWEKKAGYYWDNPGFSQSEDNPVTCVSWNDVQEFIKWLDRKEGKTYKLPTEAEWEYACRAGSNAAFANGGIADLKCGHDPNLDDMGWYCGNSGEKTRPVAQKKPNAWGLYDMHGNVWEWCKDWYGDYPDGSVTDPKGPSSGTFRVLRAGGWGNVARGCRSALRGRSNPDNLSGDIGFRLARDF